MHALAILFILIDQTLSCPIEIAPISCNLEKEIRCRIAGTVFEPGLVESYPGKRSATQLFGDLRSIFKGGCYANAPWDSVWSAILLCESDIASLQACWVDSQLRGRDPIHQGPEWIAEKNRNQVKAALGSQRAFATSKRGLAETIPRGVSKLEHLETALELESPFAPDFEMDDDLGFCFRAFGLLGPILRRWRQSQPNVWWRLCSALKSLDEYLGSIMPPTVAAIASMKRPAVFACLASLLRWPDRDLPTAYIEGFPAVFDIASSGVFRSLQEGPSSKSDFFGDSADEWNHSILSSMPRWEDVPEIVQGAQKVVDAQKAEGFYSYDELNARFGRGNWRAQVRFMITQPSGKRRCIDNARASKHNEYTRMLETIYTVGIDFLPLCARWYIAYYLQYALKVPWRQIRTVDWSAFKGRIPDFLEPGVGLDDMQDAYRQDPNRPDQLGAAVVAVYHPGLKAWRFVVMYGHSFGLVAAVVAFNRTPTLITAAARRLFGVAAAAYFDDNFVVEPTALYGSGQKLLRTLYNSVGSVMSESKHVPVGPRRIVLGNVADFKNFKESLSMTLDVSEAFKTNLKGYVSNILRRRLCYPSEAAKVRGCFNRASAREWGKVGRLSTAALVIQQYHSASPEVGWPLEVALTLQMRLLEELEPRTIPLTIFVLPPVVIYSDASFGDVPLQECPARVGWVVFVPGQQPHARVLDVTESDLAVFCNRATQITPAELMPSFAIPWDCEGIWKAIDVRWFVDNEAAAAALVKGYSCQPDMHAVTVEAHLLWARLQWRVWVDPVDSGANVADGVSRDGCPGGTPRLGSA